MENILIILAWSAIVGAAVGLLADDLPRVRSARVHRHIEATQRGEQ